MVRMHASPVKAYERAQKPRVRMHPSAAEAYERAQKSRVRTHSSAAKAYERAKKPRVRMHPSPATASRLIQVSLARLGARFASALVERLSQSEIVIPTEIKKSPASAEA
ncbi:hypothetical protein NXH58_00935 [Agathobacter ruminis]|uniref:hypothetical protein n=1 Tax=Agathobacter ruminis TaxID=1712665 RepID=UPI00234D80A8|nr:hypothetical protein [Agathobacter ruminis]MDC7300355.1 hypothetical protein [Agathobacter ruminis]